MAHTNVQLVSGNLTTGGADPTFFIDRVNNKIGIGGVPDTSGDDSSNVLQVTGSMLATAYHGSGEYLTGIESSQWLHNAVDATKIYYNGGNVGIGKTDPGTALDVVGTVTASSFSGIQVSDVPTLDQNTTGSAAKLTAPVAIGGVDFDGSAAIVPTTFGAATFDTNTLVIDSTNNRVGIGTNAPGAVLDIRSSGSDPSTPTVHIGDNSADQGDYGMVNLSRHGTSGGSKAHLAFIRTGHTVFSQGFVNNTNTFGFWASFATVTNTPTMAFTTAGNVGIGVTDPGSKLVVNGDIYATGDVTASSDRRLKTDIKRIENALDKVCAIGGYTYVMNDKPSTGLIAQEVLEVLPEVVHGSEETSYSLAYGNVIGLLVEAIKELKEKIG